MPTALAMRFDMLKKPTTAAMSQRSRSAKPASRSAWRSASSVSAEARVIFSTNVSIAVWRASSVAARQFITIASPSAGSPDSARTAAPCATWQYQQRLMELTTTAIISRSSFDSPLSPSISSLYMAVKAFSFSMSNA